MVQLTGRRITETLPHIYYKFMTSLPPWGYPRRSMNRRFQIASFIIEPGVTRHRKVQVRGPMRTASRAVNNSRGAALEAFAFGKALITPCDFIKHSFVAMPIPDKRHSGRK